LQQQLSVLAELAKSRSRNSHTPPYAPALQQSKFDTILTAAPTYILTRII
jgi:hypothetical protein